MHYVSYRYNTYRTSKLSKSTSWGLRLTLEFKASPGTLDADVCVCVCVCVFVCGWVCASGEDCGSSISGTQLLRLRLCNLPELHVFGGIPFFRRLKQI